VVEPSTGPEPAVRRKGDRDADERHDHHAELPAANEGADARDSEGERRDGSQAQPFRYGELPAQGEADDAEARENRTEERGR
jgi:hypothetical protein